MKKDIQIRKVKNTAIAMVPREDDASFWDTYFLNMKDEKLEDVIINSKGYGAREGNNVDTSSFRHYFVFVEANNFVHLEPIQSELFDLTHEFWLSFRCDDYMYDKKYIFVPGSIDPMHFTDIPILKRRGVMIK